MDSERILSNEEHLALVVRACAHCHNLKDRFSGSTFDDFLFSGELLSYGEPAHHYSVDGTVLATAEWNWIVEGTPLSASRAEYFWSDWFAYGLRVRLAAARRIGRVWSMSA